MEGEELIQNGGHTVVPRTEKGQFVPGIGGNPTTIITKENQPTGEAKSLGKKKKKAGREALRELLEGLKYTFQSPEAKLELELAFGKKAVKKANAYDIMTMKQMLVSIKKSHTLAYNTLNNQAYGFPKQSLEHGGPGGGPIQTRQVTQVIVENPHLAKDAE